MDHKPDMAPVFALVLILFLLAVALYVASFAVRPIRRWWRRRQRAVSAARALLKKYGREARARVTVYLEEETDPKAKEHLERVLRMVSK